MTPEMELAEKARLERLESWHFRLNATAATLSLTTAALIWVTAAALVSMLSLVGSGLAFVTTWPLQRRIDRLRGEAEGRSEERRLAAEASAAEWQRQAEAAHAQVVESVERNRELQASAAAAVENYSAEVEERLRRMPEEVEDRMTRDLRRGLRSGQFG